MNIKNKILASILTVSVACSVIAQEYLLQTPAAVGNITLGWSYPASELSTNLTFKIRGSTDPNLVKTSWPVLTNVIGTVTNTTIKINPGKYYFTMTASNLWGETIFYNVEEIPSLPRSDVLVRVQKIQ